MANTNGAGQTEMQFTSSDRDCCWGNDSPVTTSESKTSNKRLIKSSARKSLSSLPAENQNHDHPSLRDTELRKEADGCSESSITEPKTRGIRDQGFSLNSGHVELKSSLSCSAQNQVDDSNPQHVKRELQEDFDQRSSAFTPTLHMLRQACDEDPTTTKGSPKVLDPTINNGESVPIPRSAAPEESSSQRAECRRRNGQNRLPTKVSPEDHPEGCGLAGSKVPQGGVPGRVRSSAALETPEVSSLRGVPSGVSATSPRSVTSTVVPGEGGGNRQDPERRTPQYRSRRRRLMDRRRGIVEQPTPEPPLPEGSRSPEQDVGAMLDLRLRALDFMIRRSYREEYLAARQLQNPRRFQKNQRLQARVQSTQDLLALQELLVHLRSARHRRERERAAKDRESDGKEPGRSGRAGETVKEEEERERVREEGREKASKHHGREQRERGEKDRETDSTGRERSERESQVTGDKEQREGSEEERERTVTERERAERMQRGRGKKERERATTDRERTEKEQPEKREGPERELWGRVQREQERAEKEQGKAERDQEKAEAQTRLAGSADVETRDQPSPGARATPEGQSSDEGVGAGGHNETTAEPPAQSTNAAQNNARQKRELRLVPSSDISKPTDEVDLLPSVTLEVKDSEGQLQTEADQLSPDKNRRPQPSSPSVKSELMAKNQLQTEAGQRAPGKGHKLRHTSQRAQIEETAEHQKPQTAVAINFSQSVKKGEPSSQSVKKGEHSSQSVKKRQPSAKFIPSKTSRKEHEPTDDPCRSGSKLTGDLHKIESQQDVDSGDVSVDQNHGENSLLQVTHCSNPRRTGNTHMCSHSVSCLGQSSCADVENVEVPRTSFLHVSRQCRVARMRTDKQCQVEQRLKILKDSPSKMFDDLQKRAVTIFVENQPRVTVPNGLECTVRNPVTLQRPQASIQSPGREPGPQGTGTDQKAMWDHPHRKAFHGDENVCSPTQNVLSKNALPPVRLPNAMLQTQTKYLQVSAPKTLLTTRNREMKTSGDSVLHTMNLQGRYHDLRFPYPPYDTQRKPASNTESSGQHLRPKSTGFKPKVDVDIEQRKIFAIRLRDTDGHSTTDVARTGGTLTCPLQQPQTFQASPSLETSPRTKHFRKKKPPKTPMRPLFRFRAAELRRTRPRQGGSTIPWEPGPFSNRMKRRILDITDIYAFYQRQKTRSFYQTTSQAPGRQNGKEQP